MMKRALLFGVLITPVSAVSFAQDAISPGVKLENAMVACFWERKPEESRVIVSNGLQQNEATSAAFKAGFEACKDVYGEHAATDDGQPVFLSPKSFVISLKNADPSNAPTLKEEMEAIKKQDQSGGDK